MKQTTSQRLADRIVPRGLHSEPGEGMARVIGTNGFKLDPAASLCWHCDGEKRCACASCLWDADGNTRALAEKVRLGIVIREGGEPVYGKCQACKGAGLLVFSAEESCEISLDNRSDAGDVDQPWSSITAG